MAEKNKNSIRETLLKQGPKPPMSKKKRLAIVWGFILGHVFLLLFVVLLIVVVGIYAAGGLGLAVAESPSFCTMCGAGRRTSCSESSASHRGNAPS